MKWAGETEGREWNAELCGDVRKVRRYGWFGNERGGG